MVGRGVVRVNGCTDTPARCMGAGAGLVAPDVELEVGGVAAEWHSTASTQEHRAIEAKSSTLLETGGAEAATATTRLVLR